MKLRKRTTRATIGATRTSGLRKVLLSIATVSVVGLIATACSSGGGDDGSASGEQVLRFGISGEPQDVKVGADQGATGYMLDALIHRGLMQYNEDGEVVEGLAESYEVIDNATYAFTLREELTFSDGTPLTADNVRNSLLFIGDPANGARTVQGMSNIADIAVEDDTHLTIKLAENDPDFLQYLADSTAFIAPDDALSADATALVGAGPFMIDEVQSGVQMELVKSDSFYNADNVELQGIDLVYYPDTSARTSALLSGDVDFIDYVAWEDFEQIGNAEGLVLDAQAGLLMDVEFNVTKEPFNDPLVRQAVAYALNRDSVASAAFFGNASPVYGMPLAESSAFASDVSQNMWEYDPQEAKDLLAEAGYPDGFSASLLTTSQYSFHQDTALTVQADLAEIGITVELDSPDWATRMEKAGSGDFDLKINGWGGIVTSPAYLEAYLGGPDLAKSFGYENPELMEALSLGRTSDDEAARIDAYNNAFSIIQQDVPMVTLVQRDQAFAFSDNVSGFSNLPGFLTFYSGYTFENTSLSG